MKQTILGSNGIIGKELAKKLPGYTQDIRLVSRHPKPVTGDEELVHADLTHPKETARAVEGSEVVYVTVGLRYDTKVWQKEWPTIMQNIIDACKTHHARLVFLDNVYMYGTVEGWMTEETPFQPCSKKGEVRAHIARMLEAEMSRDDIDVIIARSADFYGVGADNTFAMPMIFDKYKASKRASWLLDASQPHSMTYTPDIGKALALLGNTHEAYNQTWHLPTDGNPLTGAAFMRAVASAYDVPPKYFVISSWMLKLMGFFSPMIAEIREMTYQFDRPSLFSSQKFEKAFFKPTPYKKAIAEIVASE